jgi:hypothetical protein
MRMMKTFRLPALLAATLTLAVTTNGAAHINGGGNARADCYMTFEGLEATRGANRVECKDGDSCDADGAADGKCTFTFQVCVYDSTVSGCTPSPVTRFKGGRGLTLPPTGLSTATCAANSTITVPLRTRRGQQRPSRPKRVKTKAITSGRPKTDADTLIFKCLPGTGGGGGGGGPTCENNPAGGPREMRYTTLDTGTDLDNGVSGASHNFPIIAGSSVRMCLSNCDGQTDFDCDATGSTSQGDASRGDQTLNGPTLGPPLPLYAAGAPVCVINRFRDATLTAKVNVQTGAFDASTTPIELLSDVYSTTPTDLCPQCTGGGSAIGSTGTCNLGPNQGRSCTVDGTVPVVVGNQAARLYLLSVDCPPGGEQGSRTGTIPVSLALTTGESRKNGGGAASAVCPGQQIHDQCSSVGGTCSTPCTGVDVKGGINQWCCSDGKTPCFPTAANSGEPSHAIVRTGAAVAPTAQPDGKLTASNVQLASVFCESTSGASTIDTVAGLPGPGAVIFNGNVEILPNQ